jgi:hypothetical protein
MRRRRRTPRRKGRENVRIVAAGTGEALPGERDKVWEVDR